MITFVFNLDRMFYFLYKNLHSYKYQVSFISSGVLLDEVGFRMIKCSFNLELLFDKSG